MSKSRLITALLLVVIAFGTVGSVSAQDGTGDRPRERAEARLILKTFKAVLDATGLDRADLRDALAADKTLADICTENGIDPQAVFETVKTEVTAEIEQAVTDGKLTREQADLALARLDDALDLILNTNRPGTPLRDRIQIRVENSLINIVADAAGITKRAVIRDLRNGKTLADIAAAHSLDADALIAQAETQITDEVNQAVTDGKITQEIADALLENLHDRLVNRFNTPLPEQISDIL